MRVWIERNKIESNKIEKVKRDKFPDIGLPSNLNASECNLCSSFSFSKVAPQNAIRDDTASQVRNEVGEEKTP